MRRHFFFGLFFFLDSGETDKSRRNHKFQGNARLRLLLGSCLANCPSWNGQSFIELLVYGIGSWTLHASET